MRLLQKEVNLENCPILWHKPITKEVLQSDFDIRGGNWHVEDGWLVGENRENYPAMVISQQDFFGDVILEFRAMTILPCTHDINAMWSGSWNYETNTRHIAYVCGLQGWWHGKVGFEKSPDYKLNAATPLFPFIPGREYFVQMGSFNGHAFILIDGALVLEITDPDPIDTSKYGRFGFEAYCSKLRFRDICLRKAVWRTVEEHYDAEF
ncbi:MAG: hypothetical protein PHW41_10655 [Eubacteriales bacterium]|nr:hypothetical protein [Eubacteriales bacterium]